MELAPHRDMAFTQLRTILSMLIALSGFVAACSRSHAREETIPGPQLGQSTARGPSDPTRPLAISQNDPYGVSAPISNAPRGPAPVTTQTPEPPAGAPAQTTPIQTTPITPQETQPGVFTPPPPPSDQTSPPASQPQAPAGQPVPPQP